MKFAPEVRQSAAQPVSQIDDHALQRIAFLAAWGVLWVLFFQIGLGWITLPVALGVGLVLWLFRRGRVLYAGVVAVLLLSIVYTVGVTSSPKTVSSMVLGKWQSGSEYGIEVACEDAEDGYLHVTLHKGDWETLHYGDQVELSYRAESILGIWYLGLAVDSINSHTVLSGDSKSFHGGFWDKLVSSLSLVFGMLPVSYLIYKRYTGRTIAQATAETKL